jgi:hypothetical protein
LRRLFWKGERQAAGELFLSGAEQAATDQPDNGSVEDLLGQISLWQDTAEIADLWVPGVLTLKDRAVDHDVAMAMVLDKALSLGWLPSGFSPGKSGRWYHYEREAQSK